MAQDSKVADALESFGAQDALVMDGFDDCIVGLLERFGIPEPIVVYDRAKVIQKLVDNGIEDHEGAEEFYYYNQLGGWHGDGTPAFLIKIESDDS